VGIKYTLDNGATWTAIATVPNGNGVDAYSGSYSWVIDVEAAASLIVRIYDTNTPEYYFDSSSVPVTITPVRLALRRALKKCLLEITTTAGYYNTIKKVYDPPMNLESMKEFPAVNILIGREERLGESYISNNSKMDLRLQVTFDCFLHRQLYPTFAQDRILADIQRYFGNNYYIKPAGEFRTAFNCLYLNSIPWGTEEERPQCGISIEFDIWYSIVINNPDSMIN
jgi:hypothetical protein